MLTSRWSLILFDLKLINILQSIQNKNKKKKANRIAKKTKSNILISNMTWLLNCKFKLSLIYLNHWIHEKNFIYDLLLWIKINNVHNIDYNYAAK